MAYFYFVNKTIFKIAKDENEKSELLPFINTSKAIEKIVTDEQFEKLELNKFTYYLDNSNNLIEIENKISMTLEESFTTNATTIGGDTASEIALKNVINQYIYMIDAYLKNNTNQKWSSFKETLSNFVIPKTSYPLNKNLIQLLRDSGYTAYHILRLP
jgi:hypothetical protein